MRAESDDNPASARPRNFPKIVMSPSDKTSPPELTDPRIMRERPFSDEICCPERTVPWKIVADGETSGSCEAVDDSPEVDSTLEDGSADDLPCDRASKHGSAELSGITERLPDNLLVFSEDRGST
mmetsp:Transcript_84114/g.126107  ORF Transcript_84114/g.126107 Transcript_84114/m.126107 type:complete len:125 (-) Transcript_84114:576-950(-)